MVQSTQIDLDYLQQRLDKKTIDNAEFGKSYYLNKEDMTIIKIKPDRHCEFEYDCAEYFCNFYRKSLGLNFQIYKQDNKIITVTPIVNDTRKNKLPKDERLRNTLNILEKFTEQHEMFKHMLLTPELRVKSYIQDYGIGNFFIHNNEIYLLDLETFYFCILTPEGHSVGLIGVNEDHAETVKSYTPALDCENSFITEETPIY